MRKLVIVLEGGGMRNAFTSGVLYELWLLGLKPEQVSAIYACSSANGPAAFFITEQLEITFSIWAQTLTSWRVLNPVRLLRGLPPGDLDSVVEQTIDALDLDKLGRSTTRLVMAFMDLETGKTRHILWRPCDGGELFKASGAMPFMATPVTMLGCRAIDGGIGKPLPFAEAIKHEGKAAYLVISNLPVKGKPREYGERLARAFIPDSPAAQKAFLGRRAHHQRAWELIRNPPVGCPTFAINAPRGFRCKRFSRDPFIVRQAIRQGRIAARHAFQRGGLVKFLEENAVALVKTA